MKNEPYPALSAFNKIKWNLRIIITIRQKPITAAMDMISNVLLLMDAASVK